MAIARPITKSIISTTAWGIPITDQVNANTTDIAALKPTAWTNLTLLNGWNSTLNTQTIPQLRKVGDNVQVRGAVSSGTPGSIIFTFPAGFRPYQTRYVPVVTFSGSIWQSAALEILYTTGECKYHNSSPAGPTYIDIGMMFSTIA